MSSIRVASVLDDVHWRTHYGDPSGGNLVLFDEQTVYTRIANQIAAETAGGGQSGAVVIMDAQTPHLLSAFSTLCEAAGQVLLLGDPAARFGGRRNVRIVPMEVDPAEHVTLVCSPTLSLLALGRQHAAEPGRSAFSGAWSSRREFICAFGESIFQGAGVRAPEWPEARSAALEQNTAATLRIAGLMTRELTTLRATESRDKHELFSVLDILKAISARRRSHDILYVFVEKIAQVIPMDRCSVLRVWGEEDRGRVLASHEDATVRDLVIDLGKYPEIQKALHTRQKVIIDDVRTNPLTADIAPRLQDAGVQAIMVVPIVLFDPHVGTLLLRAARANTSFTLREIGFCEIVAEAASNALERAHLFETIQRANERLELLAVTDGLTGLYNHRFFRDRLEEEFDRARRYGTPLSCLIYDVDNFKAINDTYGHVQGDRILKEMAERVMRIVRKSDIVARYGGEEFAVILPQTNREGALAEGERIRYHLSEMPYEGLPEDVKVTVSVGVAVYNPETMLDCESLIRIADGALYEAKRKGKNRVVVANGELPQP